MKHVAVLMGDWSAERPVSLASGCCCADALEGVGYHGTKIDVGRSIPPVSQAFCEYDAKYAKGASRHSLPANLKPNIYHKVQDLTAKAHRALGRCGVSRSDFRFDETKGEEGDLVCLEVNTRPDMTETSLGPEMTPRARLSVGELVAWMVEDASCGR
jgi:D-alanine-D-alanine ligase